MSAALEFTPSEIFDHNLKCYLVAAACNVTLNIVDDIVAPRSPAIRVSDTKKGSTSTLIFGANSISSFLFLKQVGTLTPAILDLLDIDETSTADNLSVIESQAALLTQYPAVAATLFPNLAACAHASPVLSEIVARVRSHSSFEAAVVAATAATTHAKSKNSFPEINEESGLLSALRQIFFVAISKQFKGVKEIDSSLFDAVIARCGNAAHGDFQCNNAMGLAKAVKTIAAYGGPKSPKDIAEAIIKQIPANSLVDQCSAAPNGFINIKISTGTILSSLSKIVTCGVCGPQVTPKKVLVDFSSPNIAKDMHVGHLRSTIIGDSVCRVLEFCGHEVLRINHVGDWGTQFGMLITFLQDSYPDIQSNPPNIQDLNALYKASKKRFDEDADFKERSRLNVVRLQSGEASCRSLWTMLCEISRAEFQVVYDTLGIKLKEVGESFYNPMLPSIIEELQSLGLVEDDAGMLIIRLPGYDIPLIVRKSDGGYGYDSTDMAAVSYRIRDLKCDWVIYITDAGQANHFYMVFDAARKAGWAPTHRLDHIGFGVVCGDDGKRFRTRSGETVRLIDLLHSAKDRMAESLMGRKEEGKTALEGADLESAAAKIGYGAVKYFDLKQHPATNYIFSYDRMLDTKGDTAVYLLFAYARLASILRKAADEKGFNLEAVAAQGSAAIKVDHPSERALAFELLQFGDVLNNVMTELLLNRLCEYLKEVCVKFTDFVTKCHVLNAAGGESEINSRLLLCEATRRVMAKCFELLGIDPLDRI